MSDPETLYHDLPDSSFHHAKGIQEGQHLWVSVLGQAFEVPVVHQAEGEVRLKGH